MIRIDAMWVAVEPVDMRAGADRLIARVVEVCRARWLRRLVRRAAPKPGPLRVAERDGWRCPALTQAQFDALVLGLPWQRLVHMQTIPQV